MVAVKRDLSKYSLRKPDRFWFIPNPQIKRKAAGEAARLLCDWVASGVGLEQEPDETALFVALHTCAYRASRRPARRAAHAYEQSEWSARWFRIRDHIVEKNLPLVYSMIARFDTRDLDHDDLLSEAMYGLVQATERFDPWRGFRFSTYACHAILRSMMRSRKQAGNRRRLFPVQLDLSFERPSRGEAGSDLYVERLQRALDRNLGELTELESTILARRFPPDYEPRSTLQEVGDAVGLSKERVRQLQNIALGKLREVLECDPVLQ
ncbi:MAG: sigma-70 family RNA polymerase sigma factor [Planctomycetota bacterium]|jgi:RNA polymerase sigma factor (sigma-70 family)